MKSLLSTREIERQAGTALISVMLIWAVTTFIVAELLGRLDRDQRRTQHFLAQDQAYLYGQSAEEVIMALLLDDQNRDYEDEDKKKPQDHKEEDWYELRGYEDKKTFTMPDGAILKSNLFDLQGRFNLNDLKNNSADALRRFRVLLEDLEIPEEEEDATEMALAVKEWIDADDESQDTNAEDLYYSNLNPPYRTANDYLVSLSELRLVKGFSGKDVDKLKPYVTILPEGTPININTASETVLATYNGIADIDKIIEGQQEGGFLSVESAFNGSEKKAPPFAWFSVHSEYFQLRVKVEFSDSLLNLDSVIYRPREANKADPIRVVRRNRAKVFAALSDDNE